MRKWWRYSAFFVLILAVASMGLVSCSSTPQPPMAGDGLQLPSVGSLFEKARDGAEFEKLLNTTGVNNLDLDEDRVIDSIDVVEYGSGMNRGFSLTVDMGGGHIQRIAEITLRMGGDGWVHYAIRGDPQLYPYDGYFEARLQPTAVAFLRWAFMPNRVVYVPTYRHDPYFVPERRAVLAPRVYRDKVVVIEKQTTVVVKKVTKVPVADPALQSPNEGKASAIIKAPLANPTATQKEFQAINPSEVTLSKKGFGGEKKAGEVRVKEGDTKTVVPSVTQERPSLTDPKATQKQFEAVDPKAVDLPGKKFGGHKDNEVPQTPAPATPGVEERKVLPVIPGTTPAPKIVEEKKLPATPGSGAAGETKTPPILKKPVEEKKKK